MMSYICSESYTGRLMYILTNIFRLATIIIIPEVIQWKLNTNSPRA